MPVVGRGTKLSHPDSYSGFVHTVNERTSELFYLLEAAESLEWQFEHEARGLQPDATRFAPQRLSVSVTTEISDHTALNELGAEGRFVQLAYCGWVAAIDGAWEKIRKKPPYDKRDKGLRHGQQADLFGDLRKVRNDLLKNGGVASRHNCGRCRVLRWFNPGETMRFGPDHVLEFLHHLGDYMRQYRLAEPSTGDVRTTWHLLGRRPRGNPLRVISFRPFVSEIVDSEPAEYALGASVLFADGIAGGIVFEVSTDRASLLPRFHEMSGLEIDDVQTKMGAEGIHLVYQNGRRTLEEGRYPLDAGSPPIQFRSAPKPAN